MPNDILSTTIAVGTLMVPSGRPGAQGLPAVSPITAEFTVPEIGTTVEVEFENVSWVVVGLVIFIAGMYGRVISVSGQTVTLERLPEEGNIGPQGDPGTPGATGPMPDVPIPMVFSFSGLVDFLTTVPIALDLTLPANFAGSVGYCGVNPTAEATFDLRRNGSALSTIVVSTAGAFTFTAMGSDANLVPGDVLTLSSPSPPDDTLANVGITLLVMRA
jgi:hypothetical protein